LLLATPHTWDIHRTSCKPSMINYLRSPGPEATLCWCHCWRGFQHAAMCWTAWTNARRLASQFRF
jgi:hypothetical protein